MTRADLAPARLGADRGPQALGPPDVAEVLNLVAGRRFTPAVLARELCDPGHYRWFGLRRPDGCLAAVHRALRWGDYLFLKGVFVDSDQLGGDAALRLAFALREVARGEQVRGIAAWISESSHAQLALARRLRLEPTEPPLHLYTMPFAGFTGSGSTARRPADPVRAAREVEEILARHHAGCNDDCLVPDLLAGPGSLADPADPADPADLDGRWNRRAVADRDRLLLSSLPCPDAGQLCALLAELAPAAAALGLSTVEIPVPAADIALALWLAGRHAQRISARPVRVGRFEFPQSREDRS